MPLKIIVVIAVLITIVFAFAAHRKGCNQIKLEI